MMEYVVKYVMALVICSHCNWGTVPWIENSMYRVEFVNRWDSLAHSHMGKLLFFIWSFSKILVITHIVQGAVQFFYGKIT